MHTLRLKSLRETLSIIEEIDFGGKILLWNMINNIMQYKKKMQKLMIRKKIRNP